MVAGGVDVDRHDADADADDRADHPHDTIQRRELRLDLTTGPRHEDDEGQIRQPVAGDRQDLAATLGRVRHDVSDVRTGQFLETIYL